MEESEYFCGPRHICQRRTVEVGREALRTRGWVSWFGGRVEDLCIGDGYDD